MTNSPNPPAPNPATPKLKVITFCRRRKDRGIYTGNIKGDVIRLVDRQVITPKDPVIAKFLLDDPEIEILCADEKEQKKENERNKGK